MAKKKDTLFHLKQYLFCPQKDMETANVDHQVININPTIQDLFSTSLNLEEKTEGTVKFTSKRIMLYARNFGKNMEYYEDLLFVAAKNPSFSSRRACPKTLSPFIQPAPPASSSISCVVSIVVAHRTSVSAAALTPSSPYWGSGCRMESNQAASSMEIETVPSEAKLLPPKPKFEPLKPHEMSDGQVQFRKVNVPPHRYTPLKKAWMDIYTPIYEQMKIDVRMNLKARRVELKTRADTPDISNLQKCADFVHAFTLGFDVIDAIALLRLDELYIESFEIKDVKTLRGDHLSRAIGRLSGKGGKTKFAIENASKTRIVIADTKIHILGSFANIKIARDSLCSLILGSPAGKVYSKLRAVTARLAERF
ncbi:unnamed protein product [Sphenostylis stenocarpa]|uniref:K Homology domain-containing protein n=1 Tax=Sphenostylis stenocarpa TaxID=92480 RepID=A0AA86SYL0_9FABA|nr:unnamed protein product [Sphenostylis stenocarpa]